MNRYLEHDGMKRGLKSQDCAKVLKAVQGYIPDNWHTCFQEVKGALQAADYIALAEPQPEPESKASKPNQRKYKTLGFSGRGKPLVCMACGKDNCVELRQAQEEWEKFHAEPQPEPIKPEQLDPKACRQFVEQLLAFDELEKNRAEDIDRILVALLSNPYIGVLSYLTFLEAYKK